MKQYCIKFLAFVLALCVVPAMFFVYVQSKPNIYADSLLGTVRYKVELIRDTPSPRIILVGGSSSPYGTVTADFEKAFGMPCINVGVTAYFGVDYYISMLNKYTRAGDIVIFAPEHISLRAQNVDYNTLWFAIGNHSPSLALVPLRYYPGMAFSYLSYAKEKLEILSWGEGKNERHKDFGPNGDVIAQRTTLLESGYNRDDIVTLNGDTPCNKTMRVLNRYYRKAQKNGVRAFFAFAPLDVLAVTSTEEEIAAYEAAIVDKLDMPVLGTVKQHLFGGEYFYDSNNHLTSEGAKANTALLIEALSNALQT